MFRTSDIVLIAVMVVAAGFTYRTKHEAEIEVRQVRRIEQQIRTEEDTIALLRADWSLLTQPARLQRLSEAYAAELQLQPLEAKQIVGPEAIPERPAEPPPEVDDPIGALAREASKDKTITGAVSR